MHFTYAPPDATTLKQGDLLRKSPNLHKLLEQEHPHYAASDYPYFQVLTQSCDLVRRGQSRQCNSRYISLAAVRGLATVLERETRQTASDGVNAFGSWCASDQHRYKLRQFVHKLLNNNDTSYFFLHAEPDYGLLQDHCTFLRLSVAVKAHQDYDTCLSAKLLELRENFQAALGWKVGNLYSRVGTTDFADGTGMSDSDLDALIDSILEENILWVPQKQFSGFKKLAPKRATPEEVFSALEAKDKTTREGRLDSLAADISRALGLNDQQKTLLRNALSQNAIVRKAI